MIRSRLRRLVLLAAIPAAVLAAAAPAVASPAAPAVFGLQICSNGGIAPSLCLQNNGLKGSLVANDNGNATSDTQQYVLIQDGTTRHSSGSDIGFPFNSSTLNNMIAPGRQVFGLVEQVTGGDLCVSVNEGRVDINDCTGSQAAWVGSGSGRMVSVGASNEFGNLEFANSSGHSGGNPVMEPQHPCPGGCWGNLPS